MKEILLKITPYMYADILEVLAAHDKATNFESLIEPNIIKATIEAQRIEQGVELPETPFK